MKFAPTWFACLSTFALLAACGSDDVTIGENGADSGAPGSNTGPTGSTPTATDAGLPIVPPTQEDACVPTAWYRDEDGDGVGGATTVPSCGSPGAGWVAVAGDCDDKNPQVFPGQTAWFGKPYGGGTSTATTFDYNCSKVEEEKPDQPKAAQCAAGIDGCTGGGYLPAANTPGIANQYCGSLRRRTCRLEQGGAARCVQGETAVDVAFQCH